MLRDDLFILSYCNRIYEQATRQKIHTKSHDRWFPSRHVDSQPICFTPCWQSAYLHHAILTVSLSASRHVDSQPICITPCWQSAYLLYAMLTVSLSASRHVDSQPICITPCWQSAYLHHAIVTEFKVICIKPCWQNIRTNSVNRFLYHGTLREAPHYAMSTDDPHQEC